MSRNEMQVIELLYKQTDWVTAAFLSSQLPCSIRSIKNYISAINDEYPGLIVSSRSGYMILDRQAALALLEGKGNPPALPQDARERRAWLLCKLLLNGERVGLDALSSELCISYYTLLSLLDGLKSTLGNYDLTLKTKNDRVWINGAEKNKKNLLIDMVYEEIPNFYGNTSLLQMYLPHFDLDAIRSLLDSELKKSCCFIDDFSKIYLVLYIGITLEQHLAHVTVPCVHAAPEVPVTPKIHEIAEHLIQAIYAYSQVPLTETDVRDLAVMISSRTQAESGAAAIDPSTERLMDAIQDRIRHLFNTSFTDIRFMTTLALHLESLQVRLQDKLILKNPQLTAIKESYPYMYEIAVAVAEVIEKETGYPVPEDEIAYLAMYIGIMIDYQKNLEFKVKVILFCPQYYSMRSSLADKLNHIFEDKMILTDVITDSSILHQITDYDLIISTVPLRFSGKNSKYVSTHIKSEEIIEINTELDRIYNMKMRQHFYDNLSTLFQKELFFCDLSFDSKEEAIHFLSGKLIDLGIVDPSFTSKVFEREKLSPSAFANIAIPHPIDMCARSSSIVTVILPDGMSWGRNTVNIIFMLAICDEDTVLFKDIFSFVTDFINNPQNVRALMNVKSYEEFMDMMLSFLAEGSR